MATQAALVTVLQTESARLQQYLAALPADAWTKPSACVLWEVGDVVAHLIRAANGYSNCITRGLRGDTSTPEGGREPNSYKTLAQEERRQWATANAQREIAFRERLGNDLLSGFSQAWEQFHHLAASLSAHDWHKPCYHPRGMMPVRSLVNTGIFELAIHGWDIRSALEPSAPLSPDALAAVLDFFAECPHWFFLPAAKLSSPLQYRFAFTGALSGQWDIVVEGDQAHIGPSAVGTSADATFACEVETFVLMLCGRLGFEAALSDKRLIPTGDMVVAQAFKQWF